MKIYACSSNPAKLKELIFAGAASGLPDLVIEPLPGLRNVPTPEEDGHTFEENAVKKAVYYSDLARDFVVADDSGLEAFALDGAPGIYSARYAGPNATDAANNNLLLSQLQHAPDRRARFVCVIALARAGKLWTTVHGSVEGEILRLPRGDAGFGYDPLFFYPPWHRTFAELTLEEKFGVSHRGNALRALFKWVSACKPMSPHPPLRSDSAPTPTS